MEEYKPGLTETPEEPKPVEADEKKAEHQELVHASAAAAGAALSPLWMALLAELVRRLEERFHERR
jgi:hypothetical protein